MFESNEAMYTKLLSGEKYDVLVPSDYMIQRLIEEDALQALDYSKLPNAAGIIPDLMGREYDPSNTYSVPYFWGNVGLIYNKTPGRSARSHPRLGHPEKHQIQKTDLRV